VIFVRAKHKMVFRTFSRTQPNTGKQAVFPENVFNLLKVENIFQQTQKKVKKFRQNILHQDRWKAYFLEFYTHEHCYNNNRLVKVYLAYDFTLL
jgi:hypothetical protein